MQIQTESKVPVKAGDVVYLRHMSGAYLSDVFPKPDDAKRRNWPRLGFESKAKVKLQGDAVDGATVQIVGLEPAIGEERVLGAWRDSRSCYYGKKDYNAKKQGWRVTKREIEEGDKQIYYGDAFYLTNDHYDQRLSRDTRYEGYVTTVPRANEWWFIESDDYQVTGEPNTEAVFLQKLFNPTAEEFSLANMAYLGYCANMAYQKSEPCQGLLSALGFTFDEKNNQEFFFRSSDTNGETDAEGFIVGDDEKIILAFRGTENLTDWLTNIELDKDAWPTDKPIGNAHSGFYRSLRSVWPRIIKSLDKLNTHNQPIWITGHSLGGALAALACATLRLQEGKKYNVMGAYTFGQPRVGDRKLAQAFDADFKARFFRVINDNDSVPRVPHIWYEHMGTLVYWDADGNLHKDGQMSAWDRIANFGKSLTRLDLDNVGDHRMGDYLLSAMRLLVDSPTVPLPDPDESDDIEYQSSANNTTRTLTISSADSQSDSPEDTMPKTQPKTQPKAQNKLKIQPVGGSTDATDFDLLADHRTPGAKIVALRVAACWAVDGLGVAYQDSVTVPNADVDSGRLGDTPRVFFIDDDDYLTKVTGTWGLQTQNHSVPVIISLQFHTRNGVSSEVFGGESKHRQTKITPFSLEAGGEEIIGFCGAYGATQDRNRNILMIRLGAYAKPAAQPQPVLSFNGKDSYVSIGRSASLDYQEPDDTLTLECWTKLSAYKKSVVFAKQYNPIQSPGTPPVDLEAIHYGLLIDAEKKIPQFIYSTDAGKNQIIQSWDSAVIELGEWYHLAVVLDSQQVELYVNGESVGKEKLKGAIAPPVNAELLLGKRYPNEDHFAGELADFRFWNTARSADQIKTNMSRRLAYVNRKEPALMGYWMLNRGSESTACDSTVYDRYGVMRGVSWAISDDLPVKVPTPKEKISYAENSNIAQFDPDKTLPAELQSTTRWLLNFHQAFKGLVGTLLTLQIIERQEDPRPLLPHNMTKLRPDKISDEFFVERRLNGINPGQLRRVEHPDWQYVVNYDFSQIEVDPFSIFPKTIEARFCLDGRQLRPHSIEYTLHGKTESEKYTPVSGDWERAKEIFRCAEMVHHESRSHLGRTHLNVDQYAVAYYRNVINNPIRKLMEPHFEGVLNINQRGGTNIIGYKSVNGKPIDGMIPETSAISLDGLYTLLKEEISGLTYRDWTPEQDCMPDTVENNHFDPAAIAMWKVIQDYVDSFFTKNKAGIKQHWSEIEGMSDDLSSHSVLKKELGTLDIKTVDDLKQMCTYLIYTSSFYHSWVNNKQYDDCGDVEYGSMGLWEAVNPKDNMGEFVGQMARKSKQASVLWNLSVVRYNLVMDMGPTELKKAVWEQRDSIEPGLPLDRLLMSISI
ncbi:LamG-like jellyroll fold domain-containing protein [cf. Phormidesmis sp. LEGE 11477]|uniref:lipase family protein n=1 Tax=cf. Phormidesmis sp. LEGE 11477 TaxID=1828680 RepID=UPI00187EEC16|nr:LamG-like jellyroll fold domain-containing protein [cf. Phormidesmis sp. LEGE 11477]MBE9061181.1 hypothetical protein [cf. Phormidesmis sp. LEGE 11477]